MSKTKNSPKSKLEKSKRRYQSRDADTLAEFKEYLAAEYRPLFEDDSGYTGYMVTISFDRVAGIKKADFERLFEHQITKAPTHCWNVIHEYVFGCHEAKSQKKIAKSIGKTKVDALEGIMAVERHSEFGKYVGPHLHGIFFVPDDLQVNIPKLETSLDQLFCKIWPDANVLLEKALGMGALFYSLKDEGNRKTDTGSWSEHCDRRIYDPASLVGIA
ncbi:MAG: hypothetical protein P8P99_02550 [Maricaulis sp.]|nr:hypothetical protein [Maricaulis sp.]